MRDRHPRPHSGGIPKPSTRYARELRIYRRDVLLHDIGLGSEVKYRKESGQLKVFLEEAIAKATDSNASCEYCFIDIPSGRGKRYFL